MLKEVVEEMAGKNNQVEEEKAKTLATRIDDCIDNRAELLKYVESFSKKGKVSRKMLDALQEKVSDYDKLVDYDSRLAIDHDNWLVCCGVTEEQLEQESHRLRPSVIDPLFDHSGEIKDKVKELFKTIKEQYPKEQKVIDYLDFIDVRPTTLDGIDVTRSRVGSGGSRSETVGVGRGEDYIKKKLPKLKKEIIEKFDDVQDNFEDETKNSTVASLNDASRKLEGLMKKLGDFEMLLREFFSIPDIDEADFDEHENWQTTQQVLIETLQTAVLDKLDEKRGSEKKEKKSEYSTFFKKQDPPKFKGDCLDYLDWKKRWESQVNSHKPPADFEIDLLKRNIPEQGKMKLFGVESLPMAWNLLDKLYGDKKLICQKLKNKLKTLKPKSTESHEIIIELSDEVDYLVKRLTLLKANELLDVDNDYLNALYQHLPQFYQLTWDSFDTDQFPTEWAAFMSYMNDIRNAALKKRTRMESMKEMLDQVKDKSNLSKVKKIDALAVSAENSKESSGFGGEKVSKEERFLEKKKKCGDCKLCKISHTFKNRYTNLISPSERFLNCDKFRSMDKKQRAETLEKFSSCVRCTCWNHKRSECPAKVFPCKEKVNGSICGLDHSSLVCGSGVAYCTSLSARTFSEDGASDGGIDENISTIPYVQDVPVQDAVDARLYWDEGSNRVLVDNEYAAENNMKAKDAKIVMNVAGGNKLKLDAKLYELILLDRKGKKYDIWGYGVDKIIDPDEPVDPGPVRSLFPHIPGKVFKPLIKRRIDVLIGINFNGLHPSGGKGRDCVGNLKVLETRFGETGYILGGSHKLLKCRTPRLSAAAAEIRVARLEVHPDVSVVDIDSEVERNFGRIMISKLNIQPELTPEYWETDQLGVEPPRRCQKCKQCADSGECSEQHIIHSLKEESELKMIEENVQIIDGETHVRYPFLRDPSVLPYNRNTVARIAEKLWKGLKRDGLLDSYNVEMKKYLDRGTFVKLTKEEMGDYEGPCQYITHHAVLSSSSVTTSVRPVTNSSFKNGSHSLNSLLPKGPNSLNDMHDVTVRFRTYEEAFAYDLAKAYNTMRTGLVERHVRRFVWRFNEDEPFEDYAIDRVHFGDRSAACQLESSKKKIAKAGESIDPEASRKLIDDTYVDDGFSGGKKESIERMVGVKDANGKYDGTISQILALGGFEVKEFVIEGDMEQADKNLLGNAVFGYGYDAKTGLMKMPVSLNLSKKKRSIRTLPDLTVNDLERLRSIQMTKRNLLGITNSFGDFLGVADPFTLRFKLLMRNLFDRSEPLKWDDAIDDLEKEAWIALISEAVHEGELIFPRRSRPANAIGGPRVAGLGDGALPAYGGVVYLVWEYSCADYQSCNDEDCGGAVGGGHYAAYFALGKARVTPLRGFTVPRSEMSGGVLTSRMVLRIV